VSETPNAPPILSTELLDDLENRWRRQGAPLVERLRRGLDHAEIEALTARVGISLPAEAYTWWGWHDGVTKSVELRVFREMGGLAFQALPLAEAVESYENQRAFALETFPEDPDSWWAPTWFPISHGEPGILVCDGATSDDAAPVRVINYHDIDDFREVRARSLGEMVTWWIEAIDHGGWTYNAERQTWDRDPPGLETEREATGLV
jgi:cell wall assembly regulator SMI1